MSSFNKVILLGNLTRDPETRFAQSGTAVVNFGLAVNRKTKNERGEWTEEPVFIDCTIFGKRGEAFAKFHEKGASAFIEGELRFDTWDDKTTGAKRSKLYVVANSFEFVGGGKGQTGAAGSTRAQPAGYGGGYGSNLDSALAGDDPF